MAFWLIINYMLHSPTACRDGCLRGRVGHGGLRRATPAATHLINNKPPMAPAKGLAATLHPPAIAPGSSRPW